MSPREESLDFFQGEESMFMGYLLPTLYALDKKLIKQKNFNFCGPLVNTIRTSIQTRFSTIWKKRTNISIMFITTFKVIMA